MEGFGTMSWLCCVPGPSSARADLRLRAGVWGAQRMCVPNRCVPFSSEVFGYQLPSRLRGDTSAVPSMAQTGSICPQNPIPSLGSSAEG